MASSDAAKTQARTLLRTLCNFVLPLIQGAGGQITDHDAKEIHFGVEADEFITELENFISGMTLPSRRCSQGTVIEATLGKIGQDFSQGTNWVQEHAAPDDQTIIGAVSSGKEKPGHIPADKSMHKHHAVPRSILMSPYDKGLQNELQSLRRYVTQKMPIRLLCFEPRNGKLNISLLERAEIYDYCAQKLQANYNKEPNLLLCHWAEHQPGYAILSHTWNQIPGELTYGDWQNGLFDDTYPKCQKLVNFCKAAWQDHGLTLGWIDTVCINKESSAELDESIRSMYAWYRNAGACIIYLAETTILSDMHNDPWFSRGWTFQELLAPYYIKFYNKDWNQLSSSNSSHSDKMSPLILEKIELATTITAQELRNIMDAPISRRMQLVAKRQVTREEDIAYCLMGIFDVSISTAYGEGAQRAFFRLVEEIFRSTKNISDIFNWASDHEPSGRQPTTSLFPSSPSDYLNRVSNAYLHSWRPIEPLTLTHLGLRTPILLMPAVPICKSVWDHQAVGDYHATTSIAPFRDGDGFEIPKNYHLLDRRFLGSEGLHESVIKWWKKTSTLTFGILNVEEQGTRIHIPKTCLAVLLQSTVQLKADGCVIMHSLGYSKIHTQKPIVFNLQKTGNYSNDDDKHYYQLDRSELAKHGMELITLYL